MKFRNSYNVNKKKQEFYTKQENKEELTRQDQLTGASLKEMAKKFGIEAIMSKGLEQTINNVSLKDKLYGNDFSKMINSKDELLNIKNRLIKVFENIPAIIRKEQFGDKVENFVHAYTSNDIAKLTKLNEIGIISDTQLNIVKDEENKKLKAKQESEMNKRFITEFEKLQKGAYEKFKETGNIDFSINKDNTTSNKML